MLQINTNINSRIHYDEWGSQFVSGMPRMFFRSRDTIRWQLYSETPGLDEDETPESNWTKYTGFEGVTGINAYLTADNNYTHRMKGTLESAVPTTPSIITANIPGAGFDLIPDYGTLNLFDKEGHYESLQYNGREIDGSTVVFQVDGSITLNRAYDSGWMMDAGEEVYMQATVDFHESDIPNGLFVFDITAYSEKLRQSIVYSDVESVPIRGLELAIFQVRDGGKQDLDRYVVTTFKIMSGIAETGIDPVLPEEHQNEAILMLETLIASGFEIQYSNDGETWTDTQPEDEEASSSASISSSLPQYVYFRFRSASVGGTWSTPIRIRNGKDGIRGNRINTGTAITGRSDTPSTYPTGISMAYVNDLYINDETQDVYICTLEGDEETALWMYSFCLKGDAFDAIDEQTITLNSNSELQAVAVKEMNRKNIQRIWVGTLQEYTDQEVANTDILAFITDDTEASGIDAQLSDSSTNPVQNWVIKQAIDKKQDIARQIVSTSSTSLTVEPNKSYIWNLSSNGTLSFDGLDFPSKYVEIPIYLNLSGTPTISGVNVEGTPKSGYWKLIWDGSSATFREEGGGSIEIDDEISNSSENPVQNKVIASVLALKADKTELPTIDSQLSDSSSNAIQNKAVTAKFGLVDDEIAKKQDILMAVTTSTSTSLTVEPNKAYSWTPSGNATISFNHTGLSGKNTSIPIKLTISNGRTVTGSSSSSTAVTVEGTAETGFWELIWDGSVATFRKGNGNDGTSTYTYVAYASSNTGSGFSNTPSDSLKYRAEIHVSSPITTPTSSDFSGSTWVKYIGDNGSNGTRGSRINYGTAITGTSSTPTAYATGISDSLVNDLYINTSTQNLYQCTTAGNASTALWVFACSMRGEEDSNSYVEDVQLNGVTLTKSLGVVNVQALPIASSNPLSLNQDVLLFTGDDSNSSSLKKGHLYEKGIEDSVLMVSYRNGPDSRYSYNLNKTSSAQWVNPSNSNIKILYDVGDCWWLFTDGYSTWKTTPCDSSVMPWTFSGQTWEQIAGYGGDITLTIEDPSILVDITPNVNALPIVDDISDADDHDYILYSKDEGSDSMVDGHVYKKNIIIDDNTITIHWSTLSETLNKANSTRWANSYNVLSYDSTNGRWKYENDYDNGQFSSPCASTIMPWDKRVSWYNYPTLSDANVSFTFASQSIEWEDKTKTRIALNDIEQSPINDVTNIAALSIATTMPTANKNAQPFVLFLGTTSESYTKGHLYEKNSTVNDSTITFSYDGTTKTLIKRSSTEWSDSDQDYILSYGSTRWIYSNGGMGSYSSPACPSTTMPWELSGQPWIFYEDQDTMYPTIPDPTSYLWNDLGSILGS